MKYLLILILIPFFCSCSVLKKSKHRKTVDSDSLGVTTAHKEAAFKIDSVFLSDAKDSSTKQTTGTYERETVIEEFFQGNEIIADDNGNIFSSGRFLYDSGKWLSRNDLINLSIKPFRKITIQEKGTVSALETNVEAGRSGATITKQGGRTSNKEKKTQVQKEIKEVAKNKESKVITWYWYVIGAVAFLVLLLYLYLRLQKKKFTSLFSFFTEDRNIFLAGQRSEEKE